MGKILIAPSILSCNFLKLESEVRAIDEAGCDLIHIDVMDGHFVPNLTIGPMIVKAIRRITRKPLDCHLMVKEPAKFIKDFVDAGADIITIHIEADIHPIRTLEEIKRANVKAGITLNPGTPLTFVEEAVHHADVLLVMTVNPGFGGQRFIDSMYDKVRRAKELLKTIKKEILLEVDGGVKVSNAKILGDCGADILVMGSEIFESEDYRKKIEEVRRSVGMEEKD